MCKTEHPATRFSIGRALGETLAAIENSDDDTPDTVQRNLLTRMDALGNALLEMPPATLSDAAAVMVAVVSNVEDLTVNEHDEKALTAKLRKVRRGLDRVLLVMMREAAVEPSHIGASYWLGNACNTIVDGSLVQ